MHAAMRFAFVMDPLERLVPDKDTTCGFIHAALERGHECLHMLISDIEREAGAERAAVTAMARPIVRDGSTFAALATSRVELGEADVVFVRKDPPFDAAYGYATQLLEGLRGTTLVVNDPRGLRDANEKLYALEFPRWTPRTLVTSSRERIHAFVAEVGGRAVIKPLSGAGGFGVMAVRDGDTNARAIVDFLTLEGQQLVEIQEFLPAVAEGDKRVIVLDGEPLGAILRVPAKGELRANIHVGGSVEPTELTPRELELVRDVGARLKQDGLYFVGLDLIGGHLTEVNVTSPTGIRELSRFLGRDASADVIAWAERKVVRG